MKKSLVITLLAGFILLNSCSNDLDVAAPWKDIPVVYGLLNIKDGAHYIRVEKAFLDPTANAFDIARNPDSLYYDNATVQLQRVSNGQVFTLQRVDGDQEGLPREPGVFAESPNYLYKINANQIGLKGGENIKIMVDRGNGSPVVTGEAVMLDTIRLDIPRSDGSNPLKYLYNIDSKVSWRTKKDAKVFDVVLILNYAEYPADNPAAVQEKSVEWVWARGLRNTNSEDQLAVEKKGIEFYQVLQSALAVNTNLRRIFKSVDVSIVGGGEALDKFVSVSLANTGITASQEIPDYTNLSEGKGVFSSRTFLYKKNFQIHAETRDSLKNGIYTRLLNFE
jgi:hypothetical protein